MDERKSVLTQEQIDLQIKHLNAEHAKNLEELEKLSSYS